MLKGLNLYITAPPRIEKDLRDQQIEAGDAFKLKIPFSGDGPFEVKVKKDNKDVPENDRIKISVFDDFATIAIKGKNMVIIFIQIQDRVLPQKPKRI